MRLRLRVEVAVHRVEAIARSVERLCYRLAGGVAFGEGHGIAARLAGDGILNAMISFPKNPPCAANYEGARSRCKMFRAGTVAGPSFKSVYRARTPPARVRWRI